MGAMFDVKPVNDSGVVDFAKIASLETRVNLRIKIKRDKPVASLITSKPKRDIPKLELKPEPGSEVSGSENFAAKAVAGNSTTRELPKIKQKPRLPIEELELILNQKFDLKVELARIGAEVKNWSSLAKPRYKPIPRFPYAEPEPEPEPEPVQYVPEPEPDLDFWVRDVESPGNIIRPSRLSVKPKIWIFPVAAIVLALVIFGKYNLDVKNEILSEGNSAVRNLQDANENLKNLDFTAASNNFSRAYEEFSNAGDSLNFLGKGISTLLADLPGAGKLKSAKNLIESGKLIAGAGEAMTDALGAISRTSLIFSPSFNNSSGVSRVITSLKEALALSKKNLVAARALMADIDENDIPQERRESFNEFRSKLPFFEELAGTGIDYSEFLENLIGTNRTKKYLILFQNPSELRPTGGFLGSYGVITFENGGLKEFFVDDVYNLDGQLKDLIIPPVQLQHITPTWGMRDANWFIDFPTSAKKVLSFFKKEAGYEVDGVITLSPRIISGILEIVGPIEMPDYDVVLDSKNFLVTVQGEVEYGENRDQPKTIIVDLAPLLLVKLYSADSGKWLEVFNLIVASLERKDILMYFRDLNLQSFALEKGFGGQVKSTDSDYLMITFSNVKGSKTDAVIDSSLEVSTDLNDGIKHKVTITIHNLGAHF